MKTEIKCSQCETIFLVWPYMLKEKWINRFCSRTCRGLFYTTKIVLSCKTCNKDITKKPCDKKRTNNDFCSKSCAAKHNKNVHPNGSNRSKFEIWIETRLTELYPNLEIHYNRKDAINSELDIYIPSLKLAVELNGIYHYEPIWGEEKLKYTQNNDQRKFQACLENKIELCIIDSSKISYIKESRCLPYLKIITDLIDDKHG